METNFTIDDAQFMRDELMDELNESLSLDELNELFRRHEKQFFEILSELGLTGEVECTVFSNQHSEEVVPFYRAHFLEVSLYWSSHELVADYKTEDGTYFSFTPIEIAIALETGNLRRVR